MIEYTFLEILTDMLTLLEMGNTINPTSVFHDEFKQFMLHYKFTSEDRLASRIKEFEGDGIEVSSSPISDSERLNWIQDQIHSQIGTGDWHKVMCQCHMGEPIRPAIDNKMLAVYGPAN